MKASSSSGEQLSVSVPAGVQPGQLILVNTAHGQMQVQVPAGVAPGGIFQMMLPPTPVAQGMPVQPTAATVMGAPVSNANTTPPMPTVMPTAMPTAAMPTALPPTAAMPTSVPAEPRFAVQLQQTTLEQQAGKSYRVYSFALSAPGGASHVVSGRFSDLEKIWRDQAQADWSAASQSFPSSIFSVFTDYIHDEGNVARRAAELRAYLERLLHLPDEGRLLASAAFHTKALSLPEGHPFAAALVAAANERRRRADEARAAEAARLAAIAQQQRDDCAFAQSFNSSLAYASLAPGQLTTITFPRAQRFELRNRMWGWGDATLQGPGGLPWFKMQRTNASLFGEMFKNAQFAITTLSGEPLLLLQENFRWMNYEYDLFRVDPRTRGLIPVCKIVRHWTLFAITDVYGITLFGPAIHGSCPVQCEGRWPSQFTLHVNGAVAATVDKQLFRLTDTYHVEVAAGADVLLYLGIACAIDRIHHEVEDERRRRERNR